MKQRLALPVLAALTVSTLFGAAALPAVGDVAKPGTIVTVAGTGEPGYAGDNGPATKAQVQPGGLAFDGAGNLYIADWVNDRVRKVDAVTGIITTVAGTGKPGFSGDGGPATAAQLNRPWLLVVDGAGNLYISDFYNYRVRKVDALTGIISTYAGSGPVDKTIDSTAVPQGGGFSGDNGLATDARLYGPIGLAVDAHGNLFIGDAFNNRVRKVSPEGMITTVAGNGTRSPSGDGSLATEAGFTTPGGLAVDAEGNLFITETGSAIDGRAGTVMGSRVRKVDAVTGLITTVAGTDRVGFSGDGGKATDAQLNNPGTVAMDSAGKLFIADAFNYRVRKIDAVTGIITTVAGNGNTKYAGDGSLATETGLLPGVIAIDAAGDLVISDIDPGDRVLEVVGAAAPGLLAGKAFPQ
jgi:sugar lactone lactonase YvrE